MTPFQPSRCSIILNRAAGLLLILWACGVTVAAPPLRAASRLESSAPSVGPTKPRPSVVPLITASQFEETMRRLKGKVVLVNMWATWCVPCRQEFPLLVQLYNDYRVKGFVILGVSNDDIQNRRDVQDFIQQRKVTFPVFLVDPNGANALREAIYPHWTGNIPSSFIFDRAGKLHAEISGTHSRADFESLIKPLL